MNRPAMMTANTAFTMVTRKKMMSRKRIRARVLMTSLARAPMLRPLWRTETTIDPKSWAPEAKIVPRTTHSSAGPHPQKTAMAGPTMGAAPATEMKWCAKTMCLLVGT